MNTPTVTRREALQFSMSALITTGLGLLLPQPVWARTNQHGLRSESIIRPLKELVVGDTSVRIAGQTATATGINGTVPGPLLRWREGDAVDLRVRNELAAASSIHWHGLLLPTDMDGVPGLSFAGIAPGDSYRYRFPLRQNGTYWYHSHSGFQEQTGVYGPLVIDPLEPEPFEHDAEFVVLLSDWTFEDPERIMKQLKVRDDYYNYNRRTVGELLSDAQRNGWRPTIAERRMWGSMRMKASDIADITAATYTYLMNGMDAAANWTAIFNRGQRIRLRFINGSAQTFFNVQIPGLEMQVVQADGQNVQPVSVDEFQIGTAETYDVIVQPTLDRAYTVYAESMDRSGFVRGTLAPRAGMEAPLPPMRKRPRVTMRDMGMNHGSHASMNHSTTNHTTEKNSSSESTPPVRHSHRRGPGVANVVEKPMNRLDEPGQGLEDTSHRVLRYSQLRSVRQNGDSRKPERTLEMHLTGNMERYMWSFDGVKFSEVDGPIRFFLGERLRLVLVNDTMMSHPIHLHGMFVELVNGNGNRNPRKHTVVVKPAERVELHVTADEPGRWAFHCHLLYHMKAGMMHSVLVASDEEMS